MIDVYTFNSKRMFRWQGNFKLLNVMSGLKNWLLVYVIICLIYQLTNSLYKGLIRYILYEIKEGNVQINTYIRTPIHIRFNY